VDVYTGGFPARYGNRLSGVIDINTGDIAGPPRSELGLSVFSVFANTRGTLGDGGTRFLASARRGNLDQITRAVNPDLGTPRYYDALLRLDRDLGRDTTLNAGSFVTRDDVTLEEDETRARSHIDSRYLWLRLQRRHSDALHSASTLTYTYSDRSKRLRDVDDDSDRTGFLDHEQSLRKIALRSDWSWQGDGMLMEFGAELEHGSSRYRSRAEIDRGLIGALLSGERSSAYDIALDPDGLAGGAYWAAEIDFGERLTLQPGIRWDFQDFDPDGTTYPVSGCAGGRRTRCRSTSMQGASTSPRRCTNCRRRTAKPLSSGRRAPTTSSPASSGCMAPGSGGARPTPSATVAPSGATRTCSTRSCWYRSWSRIASPSTPSAPGPAASI
jgi:hypothetical protein